MDGRDSELLMTRAEAAEIKTLIAVLKKDLENVNERITELGKKVENLILYFQAGPLS